MSCEPYCPGPRFALLIKMVSIGFELQPYSSHKEAEAVWSHMD